MTEKLKLIETVNRCRKAKIYGVKFGRLDREKQMEVVNKVMEEKTVEQAYHEVIRRAA